jgi:hypothetical protein
MAVDNAPEFKSEATPLATAIQPHIDRMAGLLKRYGLLT